MASLRSIFLILMFVSSSPPYCSGESQKELRDKETGSESSVQLGSAFGSKTVDPSRVLQVSWQPRVFFYRGFLSDEECNHLISLGKKTSEVDNYSGNAGGKEQLASSGYGLDVPDSVVAGIEERISAWTFLPRENGEPIKVTRYESERSGQNLDYFGDKSRPQARESLLATVILYLSNTTQGGELLFPDSQVKTKIWSDCAKAATILRPVKGNAILFFTRHLNASLDETSSHARCPMREGEMWVATKLFYARPAKLDRRSAEQDDGECSDEDENCSRWAALGECQKNPVYMVGSPDYFGTCRKSCNAC